MSARKEHGEGSREHPKNGKFIQQLADEAERGMEIGWTHAYDHQEHPDQVDARVYKTAVLPEKVNQHGRHQEEKNVAKLQTYHKEALWAILLQEMWRDSNCG